MQPFDPCSPGTLELACRALGERAGLPIAGGTDLIPQMRAGRVAVQRLVDLSRLDDLRFIVRENGMLHIGALTTFTALHRSRLLGRCARALAQAAALVGAVHTRNRGTIGGNIANASPAGDTLAPLLAMDALVMPISARGVGEMDVPPVAPAIANAVAEATGRRVTCLPIEPECLI